MISKILARMTNNDITEINNFYQKQTEKLMQERLNTIMPKEQFNQPTIICLIGLSNSGKSTIAEYLENKFGIANYSPIGRLKRFLEDINGLEPGELETYEGKNKKPKGSDYTFNEILVDSFHFWRERDPKFASKMLMQDLTEHLEQENVCSIQSIRNLEEVDVINNVADMYDANLYVINVMGNQEIARTSDYNFNQIENRLLMLADESFQIVNPYTNDLFPMIDDIMFYLQTEQYEDNMETPEINSSVDRKVEGNKHIGSSFNGWLTEEVIFPMSQVGRFFGTFNGFVDDTKEESYDDPKTVFSPEYGWLTLAFDPLENPNSEFKKYKPGVGTYTMHTDEVGNLFIDDFQEDDEGVLQSEYIAENTFFNNQIKQQDKLTKSDDLWD